MTTTTARPLLRPQGGTPARMRRPERAARRCGGGAAQYAKASHRDRGKSSSLIPATSCHPSASIRPPPTRAVAAASANMACTCAVASISPVSGRPIAGQQFFRTPVMIRASSHSLGRRPRSVPVRGLVRQTECRFGVLESVGGTLRMTRSCPLGCRDREKFTAYQHSLR